MDPHDHDPLDPQSEQVRRLLAEARHDEPLPDDVAARLDRVLDRLAAEPVEDPASAPAVADLAGHRRRRARTVLLAAAAAVVVGVGIGQLDLPTTGGDSAGGGDSSADRAASGEAADAPMAASESESRSGMSGHADRARRPAPTPTSAEPVEVTSQGFARDARRRAEASGLLAAGDSDLSTNGPAGAPAVPDEQAGAEAELSDDALRAGAWFTCDPGPYGKGRLTAVEYDAQSAVLAFRPPTEQSLVVELLQCGTGRVLRSMTIPLP